MSFSPRTLVVAIGVFYLIAAVATFVIGRSPQWGRYARAALMVSALLLAPLVVILSLAWSEAPSTNIVQLIVESLRLGTPIALGAMAGLWSERSGVVNIAHRGHDARRRGGRLHRLRRRSATRKSRSGCGSASSPPCSRAD